MATSKQLFVNNAKSNLVTAISPTDTVIQVSDASRFPSPLPGEYFLVTLEAGSLIEVIKVSGRSGNTFTGCERGYEGVAANFPAATRAECRATAKTFESFARKTDRLDEVSSVDSLGTPENSNGNSYICHSNDDEDNPIIAVKDSQTNWRFNTHRIIHLTGSTSSATLSSVTSTDIKGSVRDVVAGRYIIQFFTGPNTGLSRMITSSTTNSVTWATALPSTPSNGDQFEIYKSDASIIKELLASSDDGLIYSILLSD